MLASRRSPYAFADLVVPAGDLLALIETPRWASSYNEQPWRYIVATKASPEEFERRLSCLIEGSRAWASAAPLGSTNQSFALNNQPNAAAEPDLGLGGASLILEGTSRGLFVHQMICILPKRARELPERRKATDRRGDRLRRRPRRAAREVPRAEIAR